MADDLYGIADEIEDLEQAPGWGEQEEAPTVLPDDEGDWAGKRLLAIRFRQEEIAETSEQYDTEMAKLLAEIERLTMDRDMEVATMRRSVRKLTDQLTQFHRAKIAMAEREHAARASAAVEAGNQVPKQRLPTTIKSPHGQLRSRAGGNVKVRVMEGREAEVVAWLEANEMGEGIGVRVKPAVAEQRLPDLSKLQGLVAKAEDGKVLGIRDSEGEPCPWLSYEETDRAHWVTLPDGSSSKDWLVDE